MTFVGGLVYRSVGTVIRRIYDDLLLLEIPNYFFILHPRSPKSKGRIRSFTKCKEVLIVLNSILIILHTFPCNQILTGRNRKQFLSEVQHNVWKIKVNVHFLCANKDYFRILDNLGSTEGDLAGRLLELQIH